MEPDEFAGRFSRKFPGATEPLKAKPPFVAYRRSSNLRDLLVKAQLPVISTNHFPPGSFRCGQNCATCPYITNGL